VVPQLWHCDDRPARAALRVTVTRGLGRGLDAPSEPSPRLSIALSALADAPDGVPAPPVRVRVVPGPHVDPTHVLAGHKTTSALGQVVARRSARASGADRALLRDLALRHVVCADAANLFVVIDGVLVTPPLSSGALPGITRSRVLALGAARTGPVSERDIRCEDLDRAEELFLTSSLVGVEPVASAGDHAFPAPGPVAMRVAAVLAAPPTG
jgi:branched-chain amino acid aminotransferase